ncbi:peptide synthetase [Phlyctema vagabunda]|uniref:Peptide synthetase n=1 Tax=Phlyctema vagabunda TaxID=108571 RepID=A0ABR4P5L3_9HELO
MNGHHPPILAEEQNGHNDTHDSDADFTLFEIPTLSTRARDEQVEFLLLAWILLLHRNGANNFTWAIDVPLNDRSVSASPTTAVLGDIISSPEDNISKVLDSIRVSREQTASNGVLETEQKLNISLATVEDTSAEKSVGWAFSATVRVSGQHLHLRQSPPSPTLSSDMALVYLHAFADILQSVLSNQNQTVTQAIQIGERELSQIWKWNSPVPEKIERCMHSIIAENARNRPERAAVVSWDGNLTYGELDNLSTQLAIRLASQGVKVGTIVPLCFEKSVWTVVGVLAVMKAGGTFALTDPHQPEGRLQTIVNEVGAQVVLTSAKQAELGSRIAPNAQIVVVGPESLQQTSDTVTSQDLPDVPSSTLLYIIFTSGSTGKPKGVEVSHMNYTSGAIPRADKVGYRAHSRVLDFASYAFDVSIDCMLCTLSQGGCICVPSDEARLNDLGGAIKSMDVNMAHMTPSVARVLEPEIMSSLEVLGLGGESVSAGDAADWGRKTKVVIAYGPSECTVGCTINNDVGPGKTSIGKGVGGSTWIVDPDDHNILTLIGGVGELLIEGPVVGPGYLNEPGKTAEVFIEDPTWLLAGSNKESGRPGRLYKTGDLVKYDPNGSGTISFVGRKDRQVKLRGQRVELAEIEYHLQRRLPAGTSVAAEVITPGGKGNEPTLVAFLSEAKDGEPNPSVNGDEVTFSAALQEVLKAMDTEIGNDLPVYMIPTAYIPLREMPLMVSCKTDRKQLHQIGLAMSKQQLAKYRVQAVEKQEPKTEMEIKIHGLWGQLLGSEIEIGARDNFFSLGGNSLRAMKLVATARAVGVLLTVANIFTYPVLSDLALTAENVSTEAQEDVAPFSLVGAAWDADAARVETAKHCKLESSLIDDVYPCTPLQEGLMALSAKYTEAYVAQRVVELTDLPKARKFQEAFETVAADCPILRTRIVQVPGHGLMQVVVNEKISWYESEDLEDYLAKDRDNAMDLGDALARFAFINDKNTSRLHLVLTIHHALYDGWSMPLVVERVNRAFRGLKTDRLTPFNAFIKYLCDLDRASSDTYWRDQLHGANGPQFPKLPWVGYQPKADSLLEHYVEVSNAPSSGTTIATAIRGAWALVASQYTGSNDVVFGETLTGRNAPIAGVDQIEGPMITTVPMRVQVNRSTPASQYLQSIHDQTVLRIPHEHMGLQHIRRLSPDAREACELRTGFVLHPNAEDESLDASDDEPANGFVPASDAEAAREALKFNSYALMLVCSLGPEGFLIMASFDSKTVEIPQMNSILEQLGRTVQQLCGASGNIGEIAMLSEEERAEVWRLSTNGVQDLVQTDKELLDGKIYEGATATWIVDPLDSAHLLPPQAIGELLIEHPIESSEDLIDAPNWLKLGASEHPGRAARLLKTGQLAKYNKDGKLVILGQKHETANTPAVVQKKELKKRLQPTTARQKKLQQLWTRVLGTPEEEIGLNDSFFELGGDSISAMKLVSEARLEGLKLTMTQVFDSRRLYDMANVIQESQPTLTAPETYVPFSTLDVPEVESFVSQAIVPALAQSTWKITDVLPARPLQDVAVQGTTQLPRYSARYELFYLDAGVDRARLFQSCQDLVARNEILRTVFVRNEGKCFGVVLEELSVPIVEYEIQGDLESFCQKLCDLDVQTQMPLGSIFVKFLFVHHEDGRSCLMFRISHAQYDEICLPAMLHQLSALYEGRPVANGLPYSTFVNHVLKETIPNSISYWKELLEGSSLSLLRPETPLATKNVIAINKTFDISARSKDVTIATLPSAAWALCLARHLSTRDVTFGEVVSGRNIELGNCDSVIGPCWQYIPLRVKFSPDWTARELLSHVQHQHIASSAYEGMGLTEIVETCTDWPATTDWFDSVVHQDVDHVENLEFLGSNSRMETVYPHLEPLREWKIQAFPKGDTLTLEIVTFESWQPEAEKLLASLGDIMRLLVESPHQKIF